jgi:hypothetical protein
MLRSSLGFCAVHAEALLKLGDSLGITILYADIIRELRSMLHQQTAHALMNSESCPACQFKLNQEHRSLSTLADHVIRHELQDALKRSSGLCIVHLRAVCDRLRDEGSQQWLRALHAEKLGTLRVHMREFIRKHELQYSREATTEVERQSCIVAINTLNGMNA